MRKQVAVFGLGRFGSSLADTLSQLGYDVLAVDSNMERVQEMSDKVTQALQGDARDESFLKSLDLSNYHAAVVAIGTNMESSVLCTLLLKKLGTPYVIARAENTNHNQILNRIGADTVVFPEKQMGIRWAHILMLRCANDYFPLSYKYGIANITAPPSMVNETVGKAGFGKSDGDKDIVMLLMIMRKYKGQDIVMSNPAESEIIKTGDILITAGPDEKLESLISAARKAG